MPKAAVVIPLIIVWEWVASLIDSMLQSWVLLSFVKFIKGSLALVATHRWLLKESSRLETPQM
jgi:hypothetical protein